MNTLIKTFAAASLLTLSAGAMAATQGTSGATSSGSADITLTIANVIQISNMTDFTFTYNGAGSTLSVSDPICVYTNVTAGTFDVSATGTRTGDGGAGNGFIIDDNAVGTANTIAYTVGVNGTPLTAGATAVPVAGADTASATCANTMSSLTIAMAEGDVQAVPAGTYDGTVNITVAAQ
jgi:spore coat protein U-like protein